MRSNFKAAIYTLILKVSAAARAASNPRKMFITRREQFSASHACLQPALDPEENRASTARTPIPTGTVTNYALEVTLEGTPDRFPAWSTISGAQDVIRQMVIEPFDHRFLNYEVAPFDRSVPTTENVAREIWRRLEPRLTSDRARLHSIRLYETEDLFVDYFGESG